MSTLGTLFPRATRVFRTLRGGSQPALIEASDGNLYVLKLLDNPQGSHLLFNESMGTELYRACKLTTAPWTPLRVTDAFLDENPSCWIDGVGGRRRPSAGIGFGSRFQAIGNGRIFEILPGAYFSRVQAREQFWVAWFLDACCAHLDHRQAIFLETASNGLETVFIDFGHMFHGPKGDVIPKAGACRYLDKRIYPTMEGRFLMTLRRTADSLDYDRLWKRLSGIPDEWKSVGAVRNFANCLDRLADAQFTEMILERMAEAQRQSECDLSFSKLVARWQPAVLRPGVQGSRRIHRATARC